MAKIDVTPTVKFSMRIYHYRTRKPDGHLKLGPFRTAKSAARAFADYLAGSFAWKWPKRKKRQPKKNYPAGVIVVETIYDDPIWEVRYDKAYRRSLKIFKAMGLK